MSTTIQSSQQNLKRKEASPAKFQTASATLDEFANLDGRTLDPAFLHVIGLTFTFVASSTAGTRTLRLRLLHFEDLVSPEILFDRDLGDVTLSQTLKVDMYVGADGSTNAQSVVQMPLDPSLFLNGHMQLSLLDTAAIHAAGDVFTANFRYLLY